MAVERGRIRSFRRLAQLETRFIEWSEKCLNLLYQLLWWFKAVMDAYWEPNMLIFASKSFLQMHSSFLWHEEAKN